MQILKWFFCFSFLFLEATNRESSFPYISGDSFRAAADVVFDELDCSSPPSRVKRGDVVFVKTDYIEWFFSHIHPNISAPYVLVTHNSDHHIPGPCKAYLADEKLLAWFGQNKEENHPKLHPIPIGIANRCWDHGNIDRMKELQKQIPNVQRTILLYLNFAEGTFPTERNQVRDLFRKKNYCVAAKGKSQTDYLLDLARSKFVLSPRGNGLDCHRTWEALLMGAIPIVRSSPLDPLFEGLPVLIIQDWKEITEDFLNRKYKEMSSKRYHLDRMYAQYWINKIKFYIVDPKN